MTPRCAKAGWLAPGGWMAVETQRGDAVAPPKGWEVDAERDVGPRPAYAFARLALAGLALAVLGAFADFALAAFAGFLMSVNSLISRAPIAAAAALPAVFTDLAEALLLARQAAFREGDDRGGRADCEQLSDQRIIGQFPQRVRGIAGGLLDLLAGSATWPLKRQAFSVWLLSLPSAPWPSSLLPF